MLRNEILSVLLSRLEGVRQINENTWVAKCPCHDDKNASLRITVNEKGIGIYCFAGCETKDIVKSIGLKMSDLFFDNKTRQTWKDKIIQSSHFKNEFGNAEIVAEYRYYDLSGEYAYSKIRIEGGKLTEKKMQFIWHDDDTYTWKKPHKNECYLYNYPELLRNTTDTIFFTEGEKDVETMKRIGFWNTITAGGASDTKAIKQYFPMFKGKNIVILRDNDEPGEKLAKEISNILKPYAFSIKIVNPSQKPKGDITDYFQLEHGTKETFISLVGNVNPVFASWVDASGKNKKINPGLLAENFIKYEEYKIVITPDNDKTCFYYYENGKYKQINRNIVKAEIKKYIPSNLLSNALLDNVYGLIIADTSHNQNYEDIDSKSCLINLLDGFFDTNTFEMKPHDANIFSTIQFDIKYNSKSEAPIFQKYMKDLCSDDAGNFNKSKYEVLQEVLGLILSNEKGYKTKKAIILFSDDGNTGKTQFMKLPGVCFFGTERIQAVNLSELKPENRFVLSNLYKSRLITCGDESNTNITDSSIFKSLTGGDPVKIEPKGKDFFTYVWNGVIIIGCNGLPCFTDDKGEHLFDRLLIIPMEHHITNENKDPDILEKMAKEKEGIFAWAMEGLKRLKHNNYCFTECQAIAETKEEYRKRIDNVYRFVCENYVITRNYEDIIEKKDFDDHYCSWCLKLMDENENIKQVSKRNIADRMKSIGVSVGIGTSKRITVYRGIKKNTKEEQFIDASSLSNEAMKDLPF